MTTINLLVSDQVLSVIEKPIIAAGDINTVKAVFEFEGEFWQNCTKQASFWNEKTPDEIIPVIFTEDECIVPASVLAKEGAFYVGVLGIRELDVVKTSTVVKYQIKKGAPYGSGTVVDDPPTAWEQALAIIGECNETARKAERIATAALEACGSAYVENNTLHIESVGAGEVGVDGIGIVGMEYSQSLEDAGLNTLTIKLSDGTSQSFYVKNGSKGSQGVQGLPGASVTDVYTEDYVWNNGETGMRVGFVYPRSDGGTSTSYGYVKNGKSAYLYAQDAGYAGTEAEFAAKLAIEEDWYATHSLEEDVDLTGPCRIDLYGSNIPLTYDDFKDIVSVDVQFDYIKYENIPVEFSTNGTTKSASIMIEDVVYISVADMNGSPFVFWEVYGEQKDEYQFWMWGTKIKYNKMPSQFLPESVDYVILNSSTAGSTKQFKITVDDSGTLTAIALE